MLTWTIAGALLLAAPAPKVSPTEGLAALAGEWVGGPGLVPADSRFTFAADGKVTQRVGDGPSKPFWECAVNPKRNPAEIDVAVQGNPVYTVLGIYKIE